jgi:hypothetical protein
MDIWEVEMNRRILKKKYKTKWKEIIAALISKYISKVKPSRIRVSEEFGENEITIKGTWHGIEGKIRFYRREQEADKAAE